MDGAECTACNADMLYYPDTGSKTILTKSKPSDFPSFLRQKLQSNVQAVERHSIQTESVVQERCPKCGREEVKYTSVQLRSADEGSTIIFTCDCGHSYVSVVQMHLITLLMSMQMEREQLRRLLLLESI